MSFVLKSQDVAYTPQEAFDVAVVDMGGSVRDVLEGDARVRVISSGVPNPYLGSQVLARAVVQSGGIVVQVAWVELE